MPFKGLARDLALYTKELSKYVRSMFGDNEPYGEFDISRETALDREFKGEDIGVHDRGGATGYKTGRKGDSG